MSRCRPRRRIGGRQGKGEGGSEGWKEAYLDSGVGGSDQPHHHAHENEEGEGGCVDQLPLHLFLSPAEGPQGIGRQAAEE